MENKLLKIQEEMVTQIQAFYEEVRLLLMNEKSYKRKAEVEKIELLFLLVENTLQKPLNRLAHIDGFLSDPDGLMVSKMYPFAYLLPEVSDQVKEIVKQSAKLAESHNILYPSSEAILYQEPHEVE